MNVVYEICPLFVESVTAAKARFPNIVEMVKDFRQFKSANPLAPYGYKDLSLSPDGSFNVEVPKIRHAALASDLRIWYTISGKNPNIIRLYGVFSHADSGTGDPPARNVQRKLAKKMAKQQFQAAQ